MDQRWSAAAHSRSGGDLEWEKHEPASRIEHDAGPEPLTFPLERPLHPFDVLPRRAVKPELPDLKRDDLERSEVSGSRFDICEIHQRQVAAKFFVAADAFIIIEEVAATIENEPLMGDFDGLRMMRRMAMNDGHIRPVDERACEELLFGSDFVAPIRSPMQRDNDQIARLLNTEDMFGGA